MDSNVSVLIAVLITWGGVVWYLFRVDRKIKSGSDKS